MGMIGEIIFFKGELQLDHEPCLDHWAKLLASEYIETSEHSFNFDWEYECHFHWIEDTLDLEGFTIEKGR